MFRHCLTLYHQLQLKADQASILEIHHDKVILYLLLHALTISYLRSGIILMSVSHQYNLQKKNFSANSKNRIRLYMAQYLHDLNEYDYYDVNYRF